MKFYQIFFGFPLRISALSLLFLLSLLSVSRQALAQTPLATSTIEFNEFGFTNTLPTASTGTTGGTGLLVTEAAAGPTIQTYNINLWNDLTGAVLTGAAPGGDQNDITIQVSTNLLNRVDTSTGTSQTGTPSTDPNTNNLSVNFNTTGANQFTSNHAFGTPPIAGDLWRTCFKMTFNSNISLTAADLSNFNFGSLNTAGSNGWEYSHIGFLDQSGTPFSAEAQEYWSSGAATASTGWFYANSRGTINFATGGYPTGTTGVGTSGPSDNITTLSPVSTAISGSTPIGGVVWYTYHEAINDPPTGTSFTSSFSSFKINGGGVSAIPEPSTFALVCPLLLGFSRKRRHKIISFSG
jgi:hypothetical protein